MPKVYSAFQIKKRRANVTPGDNLSQILDNNILSYPDLASVVRVAVECWKLEKLETHFPKGFYHYLATKMHTHLKFFGRFCGIKYDLFAVDCDVHFALFG